MKFTQEDIDAAVAEFTAAADARVVPAAGLHKEIKVYSPRSANGTVQTVSDRGAEST